MNGNYIQHQTCVPPMVSQLQFMLTIEEQLRLSQANLHRAELELMRLMSQLRDKEHELQMRTLELRISQERSQIQETEINQLKEECAELKIKIDRERASKDSLHYHLIVGDFLIEI